MSDQILHGIVWLIVLSLISGVFVASVDFLVPEKFWDRSGSPKVLITCASIMLLGVLLTFSTYWWDI